MYHQTVTPRALCDAMKTVGEVFGEVRGGKVFGDWSLRREDGASFSLAGIEPYNAPRTMAGKDRTDPSIILEVYDWIRDREDCQYVVLGSGDSDYQAAGRPRQEQWAAHHHLRFQPVGGAGYAGGGAAVSAGGGAGFPYAGTRDFAQPGGRRNKTPKIPCKPLSGKWTGWKAP